MKPPITPVQLMDQEYDIDSEQALYSRHIPCIISMVFAGTQTINSSFKMVQEVNANKTLHL